MDVAFPNNPTLRSLRGNVVVATVYAPECGSLEAIKCWSAPPLQQVGA